MTTLKNKFSKKTLANVAEERIMNKHAQMILEAMDENELKQASQIIQKLAGLKGKGLTALDTAISQAENEVNKYTSNDVIGAAAQKLAGLVGFKNPIIKAMSFANALETAFKQIPTILKNNIQNIGDNKDKSIAQALGDDQQKIKIVRNSILKSLTPSGLFHVFKTVPYAPTDAILNDIMNNVNLETLSGLAQQIATGPKTDALAANPDVKDATTGTGEKQPSNNADEGEHPEFSNSIAALGQKNPSIKKLLDRADGQGRKLLSQVFNAGTKAKK